MQEREGLVDPDGGIADQSHRVQKRGGRETGEGAFAKHDQIESTGVFPGVDNTDVYQFLESHAPADA